MGTWRYLKFNNEGEPKKGNVLPEPDSFVWGFDLNDHKVKVCYRDGHDGLAVVQPGYLNDDCDIVAWAPIEEAKTEPDLGLIKQCGNYWPPDGTVEYYRKLLRIYRHKKAEDADHAKRIQSVIDHARQKIAMAASRQAAVPA